MFVNAGLALILSSTLHVEDFSHGNSISKNAKIYITDYSISTHPLMPVLCDAFVESIIISLTARLEQPHAHSGTPP